MSDDTDARGDDDAGVVQRMVFTTDPGQSSTLRCKFLGHKWKMASARLEDEYFDTLVVNVCQRCLALQNRSWDKIASLTVDGGESAMDTLRYREIEVDNER